MTLPENHNYRDVRNISRTIWCSRFDVKPNIIIQGRYYTLYINSYLCKL